MMEMKSGSPRDSQQPVRDFSGDDEGNRLIENAGDKTQLSIWYQVLGCVLAVGTFVGVGLGTTCAQALGGTVSPSHRMALCGPSDFNGANIYRETLKCKHHTTKASHTVDLLHDFCTKLLQHICFTLLLSTCLLQR